MLLMTIVLMTCLHFPHLIIAEVPKPALTSLPDNHLFPVPTSDSSPNNLSLNYPPSLFQKPS